MNKQKILDKIEDWQAKIIYFNKCKAEVEKKVLFYDIELEKMKIEYDKLCNKLNKIDKI